MPEVVPVDGHEEAWDAFVRSHPAGLLYYSLAYRDLLVEHLGCDHRYLLAIDEGEVRGVLPVMWRDHDGRRVVNALPWYGSHGWALASSDAAASALREAWNEVTGAAGVAAATAIANPFDGGGAPPVHDLVDERISQMTPLPAAGIDSSARRNVRKAIASGVTVETGATPVEERLDALWRVHRDNMEVIGGPPKSREFFAAVPRHFRPEQDFEVYIARVGGQVAAGLLVFFAGDTVEYYTPAVVSEHRSIQPLALILSEAMEQAGRRAMRRWNWGGTGLEQEGVYRFKRKWGAEDRRYRYFIRVGDDALLDTPADEIARRYPDFYVVPFSALRTPRSPRGLS